MTTREYAQTVELLELHGIPHEVVGPGHGGAGAAGKARAMAGRLRALRRFAKRRGFDLALSHASHELPLVARSLGVPSAYAFDYEFARAQHGLGCRAATRVVVPDAIPQEPPRPPRGALARRCAATPASRRSTTSTGSSRTRPCSTLLGLDRARVLVVVRTPPDVSLYHRHGNPLFDDVLDRLGSDDVRARSRPPAHDGAARRDRRSRLPSLVAPGARDRRAEPRRARRSRRLGRRHDESRGRRARRPRLHDVRGPARSGRRGARARRAAAAPDLGGRRSSSRSAQPGERSTGSAIRRSCSTCCSPPSRASAHASPRVRVPTVSRGKGET